MENNFYQEFRESTGIQINLLLTYRSDDKLIF